MKAKRPRFHLSPEIGYYVISEYVNDFDLEMGTFTARRQGVFKIKVSGSAGFGYLRIVRNKTQIGTTYMNRLQEWSYCWVTKVNPGDKIQVMAHRDCGIFNVGEFKLSISAVQFCTQ